MIISLAIPHCFGWEGPSCSVCINSVRLRLRPPGRAGLIGEKAWEQIGPEKAHNIHILSNIWDHCWGWKWGTCDWSWPHVAEVTVALQMWQEGKSEKPREKEMWNMSSSFLKAMKYHCGSFSSSMQILQHEKPLKRIYLCTYISLSKSLKKKKIKIKCFACKCNSWPWKQQLLWNSTYFCLQSNHIFKATWVRCPKSFTFVMYV